MLDQDKITDHSSGETIPDRFNDECAVFGVYGTNEAAVMTALGLHALQHRGQEATGIISFDGEDYHAHHGLGHVGENFGAQSGHLDKLKGFAAIGHNRYSTTGQPELRNIQPFISELAFGGFALAHNGNLTNAARLRKSLVETGSLMQSTTDTEAIVHLVARSHQDKPSLRLIDALKQVEGAYSLVCLTPEGLIGARDPHGFALWSWVRLMAPMCWRLKPAGWILLGPAIFVILSRVKWW